MRVLLGNSHPFHGTGPTISFSDVRDEKAADGSYIAGYVMGSNVEELRADLSTSGWVHHLPGNEALLNVVLSWADHGAGLPTWVKVEAGERDLMESADFERFLSEYWQCPRGYPADLEETHYTFNGPPAVGV